MSIGSIEGDGLVLLSPNELTVGANGLSTVFSGVIQDGGARRGSIAKTGAGTLTLAGTSTYAGGTTISQGTLIAANTSGSASGTGPVAVSAGTLGGSGIIAGAVTVGTGSGTGAFLTPGIGSNKQVTLTLQSVLTFNSDATYTYTFKAKKGRARSDLVIANGVTINGGNIVISGTTQGRLKRGLTMTVLSNTSANPISGTFSNLPDGGIVTVNGNNFQASYEGGDGNDLTLMVVP
jgi:fibronectin-binding autotransporter adhesin